MAQDQECNEVYLACSANLPEGLYIFDYVLKTQPLYLQIQMGAT